LTDSSRNPSLTGKPRLVRQTAFQADEVPEPTSPRLGVRFLPTIPSAPDSSVQLDDDLPESENENEQNRDDAREEQICEKETSSQNNESVKPP
jgi:hypothetical protein